MKAAIGNRQSAVIPAPRILCADPAAGIKASFCKARNDKLGAVLLHLMFARTPSRDRKRGCGNDH